MLVIGVAGQNGAGKDTAIDFLLQHLSEVAVARLTFSDILAETLHLWGIEKNRTNLQALPVVMNKQFGAGSLAKAMTVRISQQSAAIVVIGGMRWPEDLQLLHSYSNNLLIFVQAEATTRYARLIKRAHKPGESDMSLEQFEVEEARPTEIFLPTMAEQADVTLSNNGSLDELRSQIAVCVEEKIRPLLG